MRPPLGGHLHLMALLWTIVLFVVPSALLTAFVVLAGWRRSRTPAELRGDWWARFEEEFRAYADRTRSDQERVDDRGEAGRPGRDRKPPPH